MPIADSGIIPFMRSECVALSMDLLSADLFLQNDDLFEGFFIVCFYCLARTKYVARLMFRNLLNKYYYIINTI